MNEFDQFVKHELKVKKYLRYTDDFLIISESEEYLKNLLPLIQKFLSSTLRLELHPHKVGIHRLHQGVDFLGYINFPHHRILRIKTKKRVLRNLGLKAKGYRTGIVSEESFNQTLQSYLGVLLHANAHDLSEKLKNEYWFGLND